MGKINVLDFEVANLIAAGEVVDRPSSCIKELMENSIDAGSTAITVEIQRGGVAFIRITDNGCGMDAEDLPKCILRHATSKIRTASDLIGISTLGFRGEALAAISAVSHVRIMSKTRESENGAMLTVDGGSITDLTLAGCSDGTTIIVEDLFYNVPARRKFLKKDTTEAISCSSVVEKIALSHPEINIKFISDGEVKFVTAGNGNLNDTIYAIFGREIARRSLQVNRSEDGITISGYVSEPDICRTNRNLENFFINGRYIKSKTASAALEQAYASKTQADKFPFCCLNIILDPQIVDVNVHPAKLEVKFTNEKVIFDAVYYAVLSALDSEPLRPEFNIGNTVQKPSPVKPKTITSDTLSGHRISLSELYGDEAKNKPASSPVQSNRGYESKSGSSLSSMNPKQLLNAFVPQDRPRQKPEQVKIPTSKDNSITRNSDSSVFSRDDSNKAESKRTASIEPIPLPIADSDGKLGVNTSMLAETFNQTIRQHTSDSDKGDVTTQVNEPKVKTETKGFDSTIDLSEVPEYRIIGEAYKTYIIVELEDRLLMIDKHAAHERIIFDELCRKMKSDEHNGQMLLAPFEIMLLRSEADALDEYTVQLNNMGFYFDVKSKSVSQVEFSIKGIPDTLNINEASALFSELADKLATNTGTIESASADYFEAKLWQASCKAAIKGGRMYDSVHIKWICDRLLVKPENGRSAIRTCPHGRPVAFEIKKSSVDRQFDRIQ